MSILKAACQQYFSRLTYVLIAGVLCFSWISPSRQKPVFSVIETEQGLSVLEYGKPVFFYQRKPRLSGEKFYFNNYLHPVYNLQGDIITEEFPEDHFHHRGIFWAWHQAYLEDKKIGDSWTMENLSQNVEELTSTLKKNKIILKTKVTWKSPVFAIEKPFITESSTITVHQQQAEKRIIDFEIALKALVPGISIGGSEDEKGYGGFSTRIKLPKNLEFTSINGTVTPLEGQVKAGPWMDFSAIFDSTELVQSGITILCHPGTPNYPAPWILRQTGSMQNIVFPGSRRVEVPVDQPIILRYRIIIHNGNTKSIDIPLLQSDYEKMYPNK